MGYGITSESQIIDIKTIRNGVNQYCEAIKDFEICGRKVISASETCNADALSIDNSTLQYPIESLGEEIKSLKEQLNGIAEELLYEAESVYRAQYNELVEYRQQQALKQQGQTNL